MIKILKYKIKYILSIYIFCASKNTIPGARLFFFETLFEDLKRRVRWLIVNKLSYPQDDLIHLVKDVILWLPRAHSDSWRFILDVELNDKWSTQRGQKEEMCVGLLLIQ